MPRDKKNKRAAAAAAAAAGEYQKTFIFYDNFIVLA